MKIITVNVNKGGTGKSTISYTLSKWLTQVKKKKVLLIDGDRSCNLSYSFSCDSSSSILGVFTKENVEIHNVGENLDFIRGSEHLEDNTLDLKSKQNNCMLLFMWIADNMDKLHKYDYMIIDTHNDTSLVTSNFLAVADIVLGVSEPSRNGFRAWLELEDTIDFLKSELVDVMTRQTYVTAKPYLIANKVDHIGSSSRQFIEMVELQDNYLGMIQKKELLAKTLLEDTSIFEMKEKMSKKDIERHQKFYDHIDEIFSKIIEITEGVVTSS
ncbi:ParA family protein [Bacillus thuringiensis]|uniref:ParA family protein n=1 Tax=Bacillus thuringiensis TaxID=1428 RepID=UPI000BFE9FC5|nr:ParA family protein [Bacillus thuringiensis]PGU98941.1 cobalamin biosynthesis protein CobQ [Bacillus thuringiensis]